MFAHTTCSGICERVGLYVHVGTYPWFTGVVYSACTTRHVSRMICMMKLRNNGVHDSTAHDSCTYFYCIVLTCLDESAYLIRVMKEGCGKQQAQHRFRTFEIWGYRNCACV